MTENVRLFGGKMNKDLTKSQLNDLEKILSSSNSKIETEWLICSPKMESEAKRIAAKMTKPCKVIVKQDDQE
jgi:hypothetical protein